MPLEVIETSDPLSELISFETSAIYEMMISLKLVLEPGRRHHDWAEEALATLPAEFSDDLRAIYAPFEGGKLFFELAVDYPDHDDVPGFIEYVRHMKPAQFMFYLMGRVVTAAQIDSLSPLTVSTLRDLVAPVHEHYASMCETLPFDRILEDIPGFQHDLADLWHTYWADSFAAQIDDLRPHWRDAIADRQRVLQREGGTALLEDILTKFHNLPPQLPPDMPYTEIKLIPLCLLPSRAFMFFGYGNVTVLFSSQLTEARAQEIEAHKEEALAVLRALNDSTRLNILQLIGRYNGRIHGKKIAKLLDLSPSVVSRHLSQLKDSGLLVEEPQDNRVIYYTLQEEAITSLPEKLLDYIYT